MAQACGLIPWGMHMNMFANQSIRSLVWLNNVRQHYMFMNYIIIIPFVVGMTLALTLFGIRRFRMERQARALLIQHPGAEQTSVYLQLDSPFPWDKQREMAAKIAEMQTQGWTFLRASSASFFRAMRSWGGALTLHFIRTKV